jgi:transmembrane sensor
VRAAPSLSQHIAASQGMQNLHLPDGSQLYVNAQTRLRLDFNAERRVIHLDHGQLYIEVAATDKERLCSSMPAAPECG